ncbi:MAG: DUF5011 domain-containing protein [Bacilli bacterium]|nr:DUF5011 domain-containing protein [Bacilli bacterium]
MKNKKDLLLNILIVLTLINFGIVLFPSANKKVGSPKNVNIEYDPTKFNKGTLEINSLYPDKEWNIKANGMDISKQTSVNTSALKTYHLNTYYVSYTAQIGKYYTVEKFKEIQMVDTTSPTITLKGLEVIHLATGTEYKESGYEVTDNFDGDIASKVKVEGSVDYNKEGTYTLTYTVEDKRGNKTEKQRQVIVGNLNDTREGEAPADFNPALYENTVTSMKWIEEGVSIAGYSKNGNKSYTLILDGPHKKEIKITSKNKNYYKTDISLKNLPIGEYTLKIKTKKEEDIQDKRKEEERLVRAKIGNKLITFSYKKNRYTIKVEKFKYDYDIVIDPGHGGSDTGATTNGLTEKQINLEQSLYEKKRYEEHGLKVKIIRTDDTYGEMLGNKEWQPITKRAYTVGYYGSVSKYTYSNHHNSIDDPTYMGWEILVPALSTRNDLTLAHALADAWMQVYKPTENHIRMYARNYDTGGLYNKINGQTYSFKDYYAVNRMPLLSFSVTAPIYEGSYMSNPTDFDWYYTQKNYKKASEAKIKIYVEACGKTYKKPVEKEA